MSDESHDPWRRSGPGRRLDVVVEHPRLIRVKGRLDHDTAIMLAGVLKPLAMRGGTVRVDLAELEAVDATGFEVLVDIAHAVGRRGRLILRDPPPPIKQFVAQRSSEGVDIIDTAMTDSST